MFQVELPCYLGLNSGLSVWRQQNEEAFFQKHSWRAHVSPMFPSFPRGKYCFKCQFLFSRCKLCLRYTAGNFNENLSMRALAKILRARASEHSSYFCEQFEQRLNFASTFKLDRTIRYPYSNSGKHKNVICYRIFMCILALPSPESKNFRSHF